MADEKIIFSMNRVSKILPSSNKVILKDIFLSFFTGKDWRDRPERIG